MKYNPTTDAVIDLLCERWPLTFQRYQGRRKPLKLNIDHDIFLVLEGCVTVGELAQALAVYTSNIGYLANSQKAGVARIDLDGKPHGVVTESEATFARIRIETIIKKQRLKRQVRGIAA
jgi:ProP effector